MSELDLTPTPDRPKLPTRVPQQVVENEPQAPAPAPAAPQAVPTANVAEEPPPAAPIQVEMQETWFAPETAPEGWNGMPTAGYAPPSAASRTEKASTSAQPVTRTVPKPRRAGDERWRTAADEGWSLARAASDPKGDGTTRSGLPKRIPQAQLVPGGVESTPRAQHRRNPDEVRGLLSAYHRGVQRGRTDGVAETAATATKPPKENDQ